MDEGEEGGRERRRVSRRVGESSSGIECERSHARSRLSNGSQGSPIVPLNVGSGIDMVRCESEAQAEEGEEEEGRGRWCG